MIDFATDGQSVRGEKACVGNLNKDELHARMMAYRAEKVRLEEIANALDGQPDEELDTRLWAAWHMVWFYKDEIRKHRVDELRARGDAQGEFLMAVDAGIIPLERWHA
jgi:hypothetical protein